jgi:3-oxoadipate enol-lactonase
MGVIGTSRGAIGVREQGGGQAVAIVFLHGVGSDKSIWRPQLEHFGRSRRAIALDYPGYGESDPLAAASRDDLAAAILSAMDSLAVPKAHICGLSLGGVVAIAMHAAAPDRCASLVLADSFAVHPDGVGIHQRSADASRAMAMRDLAEARVDMLLGSAATPELRAEVVDTMAGIEPHAYRIGAEAVWLADQRDRAGAIDVPTLVLCGALDVVTPPALSQELAAAIPGSELVMIEGAGHLANIERPAEFNAAVDRFLSRVEEKN